MGAIGIVAFVIGAFLIDSGIQGRHPIQTLEQLIGAASTSGANAATIKATLQSTKGALASGVSSGSGTAGGGDTTPQSSSAVPNLPPINNSTPFGSSAGGSPNPKVNSFLAYATAQLGKPYQWGGVGPNSYDCSGLVYASMKAAGIDSPLTRLTTSTILVSNLFSHVAPNWGNMEPGDLVFPFSGHVVIVINPATHEILEAPHPGANVREMHYDSEYSSIMAVRRIK